MTIKNMLSPSIFNPISNGNAKFLGEHCTASIAIDNYADKLTRFYNLSSSLERISEQSGIPFSQKKFGLIIHFDEPQNLNLHNGDMEFVAGIKELVKEYGVIILKNAYLAQNFRDMGHRNRFPNLRFHRDRNDAQPTPYSLYTRNPFDEEQKKPRISSTLFTANIVAYLQSFKQGDFEVISSKGLLPAYNLFEEEDMSMVIDQVVVEHRWDEPEGVGEISILDNRTTLHSSYLRSNMGAGYRIGVRYLC